MAKFNQIRIAKIIARSGAYSRRDAERLISEGRVSYGGEIVKEFVMELEDISLLKVDNEQLPQQEKTRLWIYYKKPGLITSSRDEKGRKTVFDDLPEYLPRVITVGRLDYHSEGLLLLTNNGHLARYFELPKNKITRTYKVRVFGIPDMKKLLTSIEGITIDGINYKVRDIKIESQQRSNSWILIELNEGKNREIRNLMDYFNLKISRLIRIKYGEFAINAMKPGDVQEVSYYQVQKLEKLF